jgi:hypothetical protein
MALRRACPLLKQRSTGGHQVVELVDSSMFGETGIRAHRDGLTHEGGACLQWH